MKRRLLSLTLALTLVLVLLPAAAGAVPGEYDRTQLFSEDVPVLQTNEAYDVLSVALEANIAYASTQMVYVNDTAVEFQCYALKDEDGNDTNYVKLRDLAYWLNGTAAQFSVGWDGSVNIVTGEAYAPDGSELSTPYTGDQFYTVNQAAVKVNGEPVELNAFVINDVTGGGFTYFKLRDLGDALGFQVDWSLEKGVYIETAETTETAGTGEVTESAETDESTKTGEAGVNENTGAVLANGMPITDENIREIIYGLEDEYPEGSRWTNGDSYRGSGGCEAFGWICSDAVFGDLPVTERHSDFDRVRVGDLLRTKHNSHTVVVLEKLEDSVVVTEGNYNGTIHWNREISRQNLEDGNFSVRTRYPKDEFTLLGANEGQDG